MSPKQGASRRATHALDRDVLGVVQKFVDDESSPLPRVLDVYNHITHSNSFLKRRPRQTLEASIERVIDALRKNREEMNDANKASDSVDIAETHITEGPFADMSGPAATNSAVKDGRALNKGLTRLWNTTGNLASKDIKSDDIDGSDAKDNDLNSPAKSIGTSNLSTSSAVTVSTKARSNKEPPPKKRKVEQDRFPPEFASFESLGGVNSVRDQLERALSLSLLRPDLLQGLKYQPPRGILLHGPPGCGKTAIANAIAASMKVPFISISGPSVVSGMSGESERALRDHFEEAKKMAPSIIFIDEIDSITPKRESAQRQMETRIVAQLLTCMDDLAISKTGGKVVIVIAATNRPDSLDPALRRGGRFGLEINIPIPDELTRFSILETLIRGMPSKDEIQLAHLAKRTAGFVGADLNELVNNATAIALDRFRLSLLHEAEEKQSDNWDGLATTTRAGIQPLSTIESPSSSSAHAFFRRLEVIRASRKGPPDLRITQADFDEALPLIQPSLKREGFTAIPDTSWKDIGALKSVREQLTLSIVTSILRPELYERVGLTVPAGVLLWGPPGCGKTLLAKAVANESMANFISVKGPELMNKYVGESEREVRLLFTRARSSKPCVIFFDELDALAPRRGNEMTESSARVVNTLLTEMDGLEKREGIYIIGATNRPDIIDPAILRPGRLETPLFVDLPGPDERAEILETQCRLAGSEFTTDIAAIARSCDRFSGADLEALRRTAATECLRRGSGHVELQDWQKASRMVKPSVDPRAQRQFHRLLKTFGNAVIDGQGGDDAQVDEGKVLEREQ